VRNSSSEKIKSVTRRPTWIDAVTLEHHRLMTRPRNSERGCEPGDASPGDNELHLRHLSM
jgi:hypothetical protein